MKKGGKYYEKEVTLLHKLLSNVQLAYGRIEDKS